jgi:hypothetical protein
VTREQIEKLVADWIPRLGLEHWQVEIDWDKEPEVESSQAEVSWSASYDRAELHFRSNYGEWDLRRAEQIVVHELLHVALRDLNMAGISVIGALEGPAAQIFSDWFDHELEGFVDRLAKALVA